MIEQEIKRRQRLFVVSFAPPHPPLTPSANTATTATSFPIFFLCGRQRLYLYYRANSNESLLSNRGCVWNIVQCTFFKQGSEEGEEDGLLEQTFSYRHLWATENITEESPPRSGNPGYQGKGRSARDFVRKSFFCMADKLSSLASSLVLWRHFEGLCWHGCIDLFCIPW